MMPPTRHTPGVMLPKNGAICTLMPPVANNVCLIANKWLKQNFADNATLSTLSAESIYTTDTKSII